MLIWNVRGLNSRVHRDAVRELVVAEHPSVVCLQETKLDVISVFDVIQIVGSGYDFAYLLANEAKGGILVAWKASTWGASLIRSETYSISVRLRLLADDTEMWLTCLRAITR